MKIKTTIFILCIILLSCQTGMKEKSDFTAKNCEEVNDFKIVIWKNKGRLDYDKLNKMNYQVLIKKYPAYLTIANQDIISYYPDELVFKIKTNEKMLETMRQIMYDIGAKGIKQYFSVIVNDTIIYNGIVWEMGRTSIPALLLPLQNVVYEYNFGENINILSIKPYVDLEKKYFKEYSVTDREKLLFPEIHDYFLNQNKLVLGDFPFEEVKFKKHEN